MLTWYVRYVFEGRGVEEIEVLENLRNSIQ